MWPCLPQLKMFQPHSFEARQPDWLCLTSWSGPKSKKAYGKVHSKSVMLVWFVLGEWSCEERAMTKTIQGGRFLFSSPFTLVPFLWTKYFLFSKIWGLSLSVNRLCLKLWHLCNEDNLRTSAYSFSCHSIHLSCLRACYAPLTLLEPDPAERRAVCTHQKIIVL